MQENAGLKEQFEFSEKLEDLEKMKDLIQEKDSKIRYLTEELSINFYCFTIINIY